MTTITHTCVDCAKLPERPDRHIGAVEAANYRPVRPRAIAPDCGPRSQRCASHKRQHEAATKARRHDATVVKVYGLEPGEYERLYALQGGTCAMPRCDANGKRKRLAVDHDHVTGEVRGLLCGPHNYVLLGRFAGDLGAALAYLADPPARRLAS